MIERAMGIYWLFFLGCISESGWCFQTWLAGKFLTELPFSKQKQSWKRACDDYRNCSKKNALFFFIAMLDAQSINPIICPMISPLLLVKYG